MARHGSRSSSKGKIVKRCPCGGLLRIILSDHYNLEAVCVRCGFMRDEHRMPNGFNMYQWDRGKR